MHFVDEAIIEITGGDGGAGCISFLRSKYQPRGGPNGGNGGRGGHVILIARAKITTLADHSYIRYFRAEKGKHGQAYNKIGATGKNKIIIVPLGTMIFDHSTDKFLADLTKEFQEFIAAKGGRGGKGNRHFISPTCRAPIFAQPGEIGEKRILRLEFKMLTDVGLIGLPNAGKSSLIRTITAARPKVADYPFTTLSPCLGVIKGTSEQPIIIVDIPSLTIGAHQGAGLGLNFLKHVKRSRIFLYVIDMSSKNPIADLETILAELRAYDPTLLTKPGLVAANKLDIPGALNKMNDFRKKIKNMNLEVFGLSTNTNQGIDILVAALSTRLAKK